MYDESREEVDIATISKVGVSTFGSREEKKEEKMAERKENEGGRTPKKNLGDKALTFLLTHLARNCYSRVAVFKSPFWGFIRSPFSGTERTGQTIEN